MRESILSKLKAVSTQSPKQAFQWFKQQAARLSNVTPDSLMRDSKNTVGRLDQFGMYMFHYDPKLKAKLPYYDTFPVIIAIEKYKDGFLGINFHYLPPKLRLLMLESIRKGSTPTYAALRRNKYIRPTIKRYLNNHVTSRFLKIDKEEWDTTILLPVERFVKSTKKNVWANSKSMI